MAQAKDSKGGKGGKAMKRGEEIVNKEIEKVKQKEA